MSEGRPGPVRLAFQGARSSRSACNEGSSWPYRNLISATSFASTANVVRASFLLTLPECLPQERIPGAILRPSLAHRAREHRAENGSQQGPPVLPLSLRRLSENK